MFKKPNKPKDQFNAMGKQAKTTEINEDKTKQINILKFIKQKDIVQSTFSRPIIYKGADRSRK